MELLAASKGKRFYTMRVAVTFAGSETTQQIAGIVFLIIHFTVRFVWMHAKEFNTFKIWQIKSTITCLHPYSSHATELLLHGKLENIMN